MARFKNPLDHVRVAAPCEADWDQMIGSERVRFCGQCSLNVYNLSAMTKADAESLIAGTEGRLCVRFYRRRDGSIITDDCPVGLRAIRRRMSYLARAAGSMVLGLFAGLGVHEVFTSMRVFVPLQRTMGVLARNVEPPPVEVLGQPIPPAGLLTQGKMIRIEPTRHRLDSRRGRNTSKR
jgi:hypothetical protein